MDETAREVRVARNEALFREVNERVKELNVGLHVDTPEWVCECPDVECVQQIPLSLADYERIRRIPTHFLVLPGHVYAAVERVVEEHEGYVVVEKHGNAGAEAIRLDREEAAGAPSR